MNARQESQAAIDDARRKLAAHVSDGSGWCVACGERLPCVYVQDAKSILVRTGELTVDDAWPGEAR